MDICFIRRALLTQKYQQCAVEQRDRCSSENSLVSASLVAFGMWGENGSIARRSGEGEKQAQEQAKKQDAEQSEKLLYLVCRNAKAN